MYNAALHRLNPWHKHCGYSSYLEQAFELSEITALIFFDPIKRIYPFPLLATYGMFLCCYFFFDDYSDPYRFFARVLFVLGFFVFYKGIKNTWRHPVFFAVIAYMAYLLLSGFWSNPLDWFQLGQKLTICIYLFSFIAITYFLVNWNQLWFDRMLQVCALIAAVAAAISILAFYRENPFPTTRLDGIGSLTNVNEFSVLYGVFALIAMRFALQKRKFSHKLPFILGVQIFLCFAWFGQSRSAFAAMMIALLALAGLTLKERKTLYLFILAVFAGTLAIVFPDSAMEALHRGEGLRPQIWALVWNEAISAPIVGHGLVSNMSLAVGDHVFENAHSAYLQVFWQGGVIGLGLFIFLLGLAFRHSWSLGAQQGDYMVFALLLFAAIALTTDLDTLIARPREQWLLFWFPLALLLSYQGKAPDTPPPAAPAVPQQAGT